MAASDMIEICPGGLHGSLRLPPSKSHTLRAILFAALADGISCIDNVLDSPDTDAMIAACQSFGAHIERASGTLKVTGGLQNIQESVFIDAQNSGIVLRFMAAVGATTGAKVTVTSDGSCRPVEPLIQGLRQMGAICTSQNGFAPITVQGPIRAGKVVVDGQDSQPVSALMIAASMLPGTSEIEVQNLGERPWLNMTLDWLKRVGVCVETIGQNAFRTQGQKAILPFHYTVPADLSSLAFPLTAAVLTDSELVIENVPLDDCQGDKVLLEHLKKMGASFDYTNGNLYIKGPQKLVGSDIDVNDCIDALPILAVAACFADGKTRLYNGAIARKKESDRIACMHRELSKMGARIIEMPDGLTIERSHLTGASLEAHKDHRVAMALAVAAFASSSKSMLEGAFCVKKTYRDFFLEFRRLGIKV